MSLADNKNIAETRKYTKAQNIFMIFTVFTAFYDPAVYIIKHVEKA